MSATLDGARVASLLDGAGIVESQGRAFPVDTRWIAREPDVRIEEAMAEAVLKALRTEPGSVLAFLPGQGEIIRTAALLAARLRPGEAELAPLYGALDRAAQDRAVRPSPSGSRRIVLATSIAESSLTIEGIRVVVDSGLARVPRYEPDLGLTRLETTRVSRASADQRRGRAGRTEPGVCYRLWAEAADGAMPPFARPEMLDADLSGLLLDLATWGVTRARKPALARPAPCPRRNRGAQAPPGHRRARRRRRGDARRAGRGADRRSAASRPHGGRGGPSRLRQARRRHRGLAGRTRARRNERRCGRAAGAVAA